MPGQLLVIATPIGNLGDLPPRAVEAFRQCTLLACEDTRVTGKLLQHLELRCPMVSYREENELRQAPILADRIAAGETIGLVCDAGTPALSDPGFRLVRECRRRGLTVSPIPGPSSILALLSVSGMPTDRFLYQGFLPQRSAARRRTLESLRALDCTLVFLESCHRILSCLEDITETLGPDRCLCLGREITKLHETFLAGPASSVLEALKKGSQKGEFTVAVAPEGFVL